MANAHADRVLSRGCLLLLTGWLLLPDMAAGQDFAAKGFNLAPHTAREASKEDLAAGKALYEQHCSQCHGEKGDGQGVAAELLSPRPRDFRRGIYKIRRTTQGELPADEDLFRIIGNGMPGTSMPEWRGRLTDAEIWQVVHYLKSFSLDFEDYPVEQVFELKGKPEATPESVARGAEIYQKAECAKCHGKLGRGDGPSAATLEDEWEFRIFPADITEPWNLRGGGSVEDFFRTVTTGVNGTPMPSFSDAWDAEDLWHLANYLHSLGREPNWGEIIRAPKTQAIPDDPNDPDWDQAPALDIRLAGQIIQAPRLFNPSVQSLSVQALFDERDLALRLTWTDKFENNGQDEKPSDRISALFPAREMEGGKKPYFLMGDRRNPVDSWRWSAGQGIETFLGRGMDDVVSRASPVSGHSTYGDGQYRVVLRRSLGSNQDDEVDFVPGKMIPVAFNVWDGETGEDGKRRAISRWYYLLLKPETPWTTWLWPFVVVVLAAGGEVFGLRRLRQRWAAESESSTRPGAATS
ncbi:MAG: c-type cytochrome [Myxococcales bacterium]|nr:c-type cytochrome [Myxococcales bacterium]